MAGDGLSHLVEQQADEELPERFDSASLFIDDCPDANPLKCFTNCTAPPVDDLGRRGQCWSWDAFQCIPCTGGWDGTAAECNEKFPACNDACFTDFAYRCFDA